MSNKKSYDVFISYRREGGLDFARSIAYYLRIEGLQCFFDQRELKTGQFNKQIYSAIENSRYFLAVITPGSLDRCASEGDWVRMEILHAIENKLTIIPVAVRGEPLVFPDNLPPAMDELRTAQASFIDRQNDFEETIVKMLRNQMPDLSETTNRQRRKSQRLAEKVFIKKARRFKGNDGVIDADERTELERLASACGIGRNRLEELIEDVELAAARRAKVIAWIKSHRLLSTSVLLAVAAGVILPLWMLLSPSADDSQPHSRDLVEAADESSTDSVDSASHGTPSKPEMDFAREKLAKVDYDVKRTAEMDLRRAIMASNVSWDRASATSAQQKIDFPRLGWVKPEIDAVLREGRRLRALGMQSSEVVRVRPDLVLRLAEVRQRCSGEMLSLIVCDRHEEALEYYNAARTVFRTLGMTPLDRPDLYGNKKR